MFIWFDYLYINLHIRSKLSNQFKSNIIISLNSRFRSRDQTDFNFSTQIHLHKLNSVLIWRLSFDERWICRGFVSIDDSYEVICLMYLLGLLFFFFKRTNYLRHTITQFTLKLVDQLIYRYLLGLLFRLIFTVFLLLVKCVQIFKIIFT